jgi:hypothetical protein
MPADDDNTVPFRHHDFKSARNRRIAEQETTEWKAGRYKEEVLVLLVQVKKIIDTAQEKDGLMISFNLGNEISIKLTKTF